MKFTRWLLFLGLTATPVVGLAKPLSENVVAQAAARIDQLLDEDLARAKLKPNPLADDATFLRRSYLGIVGRIPSAEEASAFLQDASPKKRDALVERLVASPGFDSHLFNWAGDLLRVQTRQDQFGLGWHVWLRKSLADDKPWNVLVSEMLSSSGHCTTNPAVGYYLRDRNMLLDNFSNTMQVFLGRQIGCAQCHDHPFEDWSQREYYQMAAFGGGVQYRSAEARATVRKVVGEVSSANAAPVPPVADGAPPVKKAAKADPQVQQQRREKEKLSRKLTNQFNPLFKDLDKNAILDEPNSKLRLPADYKYKDGKPGEVVPPETLFGPKVANVVPSDRRESFAAWVVSPENPYFTRTIANRLWQRTFGHVILGTAVDDLKDDSPSFHPEVVKYLETTMKGAHYDLRQFLRILYRTRLFQRECLAAEPAMGEPLAFQGPLLTRMSAEQLYDSFIVLSRGDVDDTAAPGLVEAWEAYGKQLSSLLHAETRDLVILAESAKQGEERFRKAQVDLRTAQKVLADAASPDARKKAQTDLQDARRQVQEARAQAEPLKSMPGKNKPVERNQGFLRASEQPAPFNPGSLVREFGGSDRHTPSSGNTQATIPQALALLNNPKTDIIDGKRSHLSKALLKLPSPEARLDYLFLTLFARHPAAQEKQRYLSAAGNDTTLRDLASAMLTSNRFIFVQ
ncbi:MAG: DUF1549 domain-containing protein [Luteolibacter sp.]